MRKFIFLLTMLAAFLLGASTVEAQNLHPGSSNYTHYFYMDYPVVQDYNTQNVYLDVFPIDVCNDIPRPVTVPYGETEAPKFCVSSCDGLGLKPNIRLAVRKDDQFIVEYVISFSTTNASGSFNSIDNGELIINNCFKPNVTGPCVVEYTIPYDLLKQNGAGYYRIEAIGGSWGGPLLSHTEYYEFPDLNNKFSIAGNWSSYATPNTNPINVCSDNLTIDIASDMKSFVHFFENLPYGPQKIHSGTVEYSIYSADANGNIVPGFHLTLGYGDLAPFNFNLNTATGGYFANNGGYYLIKSSYVKGLPERSKPCNNPAEDSWILIGIAEPINTFHCYEQDGNPSIGTVYIDGVPTPTYGRQVKDIPSNTSLTNPIYGCIENFVTFVNASNPQGALIGNVQYSINQYNSPTSAPTPVIQGHSSQLISIGGANYQGLNISGIFGYVPGGLNQNAIYEIIVEYENICGNYSFTYYYVANQYCKKGGEGISNTTISNNEITLLSNPVSNKVELDLGKEIKNYDISLLDISGKIINNVSLREARSKQTLDISNVANGIYFIVVEDLMNKEIKKHFKIVKQ